MKTSRQLWVVGYCLLLAACVTVNVYFPAAAAEKVVDKFVKDVYGETEEQGDAKETDEQPEANLTPAFPAHGGLVTEFVNLVVPVAQAAQPNIDVATPATNKLKASMTARHQQLIPFYGSGAVGMTRNALLVVKDAKAVSLKERNIVKQLVAEENRDRNQLYKEIAVANGQPAWEKQIRDLFAQRWIANAPAGWWYDLGGWKQK